MNRYQILVKLIEDNNLKVIKKTSYDPQSDWRGEHVYIVGDDFKFDLSINGFCFNEESVDKATEAIRKYIGFKNLDTLDDLKEYLDEVAVNEHSK
ncbi:hypothetical protein [uncultured Streptococcus sp.]|uniref:hypothetical protein n=1 Tax=uncultured Streptococcus sp. TaxID=83427 RepID=UPI002676D9B9|nr:hypothetical protein [uncultured Streptococcus sp.]